jgi:hypothetical protein
LTLFTLLYLFHSLFPSHYYSPCNSSVLYSFPSLFKWKLIDQRGFIMLFHLWVYCHLLFNNCNTSVMLLLLSIFPAYPYYSRACSEFPYSFFLYTCITFQYYSLSVIIFLFVFSLFSSNSPTTENMLYMLYIYIQNINIYIWSYLYLCLHLSFWHIFHIWQKTCALCLSEPGLLHLTRWSPVPSIYLKIS